MSDKWEWRAELAKARVSQEDVGTMIGLTKSQMSHLVTKMVQGQGLTATALDKERWGKAVEYVDFKQNTKEV
jgi:predicted XRE-type DNA-binding protein